MARKNLPIRIIIGLLIAVSLPLLTWAGANEYTKPKVAACEAEALENAVCCHVTGTGEFGVDYYQLADSCEDLDYSRPGAETSVTEVEKSICEENGPFYGGSCFDVQENYYAAVFAIFGALFILGGLFIRKIVGNQAAQIGLILGGNVDVIVAIAQYWNDLSGFWHVFIPFVYATVLIVLALRRFKD